MDITIIEGNASIEFKLNAETVLSEIDASLYQDTNDSPQSQNMMRYGPFPLKK